MKRMTIFSLVLLLFCSACGSDAAQLTVVTGIGVDGLPGEYEVGAEVIRLTDQKDGGQSTYLSGSGLTLTDGIDRMVSMTGRSLRSNHAQVLLIHQKTARKGLRSLLEELLRSNHYPVFLRLAITKDSAAKTLQAKPVVSDLHSVEMEDMIREGAKHGLAPDQNIGNFYQEMCAPGIEAVLPFIELRENKGEQVCSLAGSVLFRGEVMDSVLDERDTRCLLWMRGHSGGTLVTDCATFEVMSLKRKLTATPETATICLEVTLKASDNEENREALIREAEQELHEQCTTLLRQLKKLECDAIGFGNRIYQKHPSQWKALEEQWPQTFAEYPIRVEVTVKHIIWGRVWSNDGTRAQEEIKHGS